MKISGRVNSLNCLSYGKFWQRPDNSQKANAKENGMQNSAVQSTSGENGQNKGGMYVTPIETTKAQQGTIQRAMDELSKVNFSTNDVLYMKNLGVNLPFENGKEAVDYLNSKNIDVMYANFSNKNVHACLDTTQNTPVVLINSNYKDLASFPDILAISEAMLHEAGHAKDDDSDNSIQEEIDCLALNVLAHQHYKETYPDIFKDQNSPLFFEGVSLYNKLFFDFDPEKTALKKRIAEKYGFLNASSKNHLASNLAHDIKNMPNS